MIANLLNTLLGIALVYCAVLSPGVLAGNAWGMFVAGVAVIGLALWARTAEAIGWFSTTNITLGIVLLILGALRATTDLTPVARVLEPLLGRQHRFGARALVGPVQARSRPRRYHPSRLVSALVGWLRSECGAPRLDGRGKRQGSPCLYLRSNAGWIICCLRDPRRLPGQS